MKVDGRVVEASFLLVWWELDVTEVSQCDDSDATLPAAERCTPVSEFPPL